MKTKTTKRLLPLATCILYFMLPGALASCSDKTAEATTAEQVKETMPAELKDTTVMKQEEENALDKLNTVLDTGAKK